MLGHLSMNEHEQFLQNICDVVDVFIAEHLPSDLSLEDIQVNIKLITGKNPLGTSIRLLGSTVFARLETIKFDTPSTNPGQRAISRMDKFLGLDVIWVNIDHLSSVYPAKDMDIYGKTTKTCYVSIMDESLFRLQGTCEEFFERIQTPLMDYLTKVNASSLDPDPQTIEDVNDYLD